MTRPAMPPLPRRGVLLGAGAALAAPALAATERERVFSPFHRLGGDSRGMGLGLALVRQIARLHGGEAIVAPRPGHPGCFQVSLPMPSPSS